VVVLFTLLQGSVEMELRVTEIKNILNKSLGADLPPGPIFGGTILRDSGFRVSNFVVIPAFHPLFPIHRLSVHLICQACWRNARFRRFVRGSLARQRRCARRSATIEEECGPCRWSGSHYGEPAGPPR
jgi:hypothetical protein